MTEQLAAQTQLVLAILLTLEFIIMVVQRNSHEGHINMTYFSLMLATKATCLFLPVRLGCVALQKHLA